MCVLQVRGEDARGLWIDRWSLIAVYNRIHFVSGSRAHVRMHLINMSDRHAPEVTLEIANETRPRAEKNWAYTLAGPPTHGYGYSTHTLPSPHPAPSPPPLTLRPHHHSSLLTLQYPSHPSSFTPSPTMGRPFMHRGLHTHRPSPLHTLRPFMHRGTLYWSYALHPHHVVLSCDVGSGECHRRYSSSSDEIWSGLLGHNGLLHRPRVSTPPLTLPDGTRLGIGHSATARGVYMHFLYEMSDQPPFAILRTSRPFRFFSARCAAANAADNFLREDHQDVLGSWPRHLFTHQLTPSARSLLRDGLRGTVSMCTRACACVLRDARTARHGGYVHVHASMHVRAYAVHAQP